MSVELSGVGKRYGSVTALADVDLTVEPGEVHCLVGPNGSGKTTLVRLLVGLADPSTGTVERHAGHVGCGFQTPSFFPDLTVRENLRVFAALDGVATEWVETVAADLGLESVAAREAGDLSGGYSKRLDVALAFVRRPAVVVLDEPLNDLDGDARRRVLTFVDDYRTDDRTVVVATHDLTAFEPAADRVTVLEDGRVVADERVDGSDGRPISEVYPDVFE